MGPCSGYCATCCIVVKHVNSFTPVTHCPNATKPSYCDGGPDCCSYWVGGTYPLPIHVHGRLHPHSPASDPLLSVPLAVTPPIRKKGGFNICSVCVLANRTAHMQLQQQQQQQLQLQQQQQISQQQGAVLLNVALVAGIVNTSAAHGLAHKPRVPLGELPALGQEQQQSLPGGFSAALSRRQPHRQSQHTGSAKSSIRGVDVPTTDMPVAGSTAFPPVPAAPVPAPAASPAAPAVEVEPIQPPMTGVRQPRFDATFTGTVPSAAEVLFLAMTRAYYPDFTFNASAPLISNLSQDAFYERLAPLFTALTSIPCTGRSIRSYVHTARCSRASLLHARKRANVFAPQIAHFCATDAGRHLTDLLSSFEVSIVLGFESGSMWAVMAGGAFSVPILAISVLFLFDPHLEPRPPLPGPPA